MAKDDEGIHIRSFRKYDSDINPPELIK